MARNRSFVGYTVAALCDPLLGLCIKGLLDFIIKQTARWFVCIREMKAKYLAVYSQVNTALN
jgi:hypothetical protein